MESEKSIKEPVLSQIFSALADLRKEVMNTKILKISSKINNMLIFVGKQEYWDKMYHEKSRKI